MDATSNQDGEIFRVAGFLKSVSGQDYASGLPPAGLQDFTFGDVNILALYFWSDPGDPGYSASTRWTLIKEGLHQPRDTSLFDLLFQFHVFGEHILQPEPLGLKVIYQSSKAELHFQVSGGEYIYLRGSASTQSLN